MADGALNCFAGAAVLHQRLTLGDAARRNISNEGRVWIANRCLHWIYRRFDDPMADRLGATVGNQNTMARVAADVCFRWCGSLNNFHPGNGLDGRKIFRGLTHIFIGYILGNRTHALVVFAGSTLEILHLAHDVLGGKAGDIGGFRMALTGHKMAGAADRPGRCVRTSDDLGSRRMFVGKPVGRICRAADLGRVVFLGAARHTDRSAHPRRGRLIFIGNVIGP